MDTLPMSFAINTNDVDMPMLQDPFFGRPDDLLACLILMQATVKTHRGI